MNAPGTLRIKTIDAHAEGEPLRVIVDGFPKVEGSTVLEYRRYLETNLDHLRTALMWEPRGHADMYGCLILPPVTDGAHFSVVFMHNEGYSTMCGHGIIAVTRVAVEEGIVAPSEPVTEVRIDTPAGRVTSFARSGDGKVTSVYFDNVPSFVDALDWHIGVPGLGRVRFDLAFGGAYYAYVDAGTLGLKLDVGSVQQLIDVGRAVKHAVMQGVIIRHPVDAELAFLYGTVFVGPPENPGYHSRNVCIFADGEVDRSPTGTGVSGRLAILHARGEVEPGREIVIESLIGSCFTCHIERVVDFHGTRAVVPRVEGRTYVTGRHEFVFDPADPLKHGFLIR